MACYHAWGITKCFKSLRGLLRNHQATWSFIMALTNRLLARGMRWGGERGLLFKPWKEPKFTELNNGSAESAEPRGWKGLIRARNVSSEQTPEQRGQATGLAGSSLSQPRSMQDLSPGQAGTHSLAVSPSGLWHLSPSRTAPLPLPVFPGIPCLSQDSSPPHLFLLVIHRTQHALQFWGIFRAFLEEDVGLISINTMVLPGQTFLPTVRWCCWFPRALFCFYLNQTPHFLPPLYRFMLFTIQTFLTYIFRGRSSKY